MMLLLFIILGTAASARESGNGDSLYVVGVRQPPSVLFSCNAFFVSKEYLIGTAACFLCNQNCSFQVVVGKSNIREEDKEVYDVSKVFMHPKYIRGSGNMYNIAVIKLQKPAANPVILQPVNKTIDDWGQVSTWVFSEDMKQYFLQPTPFRRLSTKICKEGNVVVASDEYCAATSEGQTVAFGAHNEGVPHVVGISGIRGNDAPKVLGFRSHIDNETPGTYFAFTSISQYYSWIMSIISPNIHPNGVPISLPVSVSK